MKKSPVTMFKSNKEVVKKEAMIGNDGNEGVTPAQTSGQEVAGHVSKFGPKQGNDYKRKLMGRLKPKK